jgi:hypothetical protein
MNGRIPASYERHVRSFFLGLLMGGFLIVVFLLVVSVGYETNDDPTMRAISSGAYSHIPDEHLVFSNVLLGFILKILYTLRDNVDWHSSLLYLMHAVSFGAFWKLVFRHGWSLSRVVGFLLLYAVFLPRFWIQLQFTTVAFSLALAGVFWMLVSIRREGLPDRVFLMGGAGLFLWAWFLRLDAAGLACVVCGPLILYYTWRKRSVRVFFSILLVLVLAVILSVGDRFYYWQNMEWKRYLLLCNAEGLLLNNHYYHDVLSQAIPVLSWSRSDAILLRDWFFLSPDFYSEEALRRIIELKVQTPVLPFSQYYWAYTGIGFQMLMLGFLPLLPIVGGYWNRRREDTILLVLVTVYAICLYLVIGQFRYLQPRVAHTLPFFMSVVALFLYTDRAAPPEVSRVSLRSFPLRFWLLTGGVLVVYLYAGQGYARSLLYTHQHHAERARWRRVLEQELHDMAQETQIENPIIVHYPLEWAAPFVSMNSFRLDHTICRGWLLHSPVFQAQRERLGLSRNIFRDFLRPDVWVVGTREEMERVRAFLAQHENLSVEIQEMKSFQTSDFKGSGLWPCGLYRFVKSPVSPQQETPS